MNYYRFFVAAILILLFIGLPKIYGQDKTKTAQRALSMPEIVFSIFDPLATLETIKLDTTELKAQIEQITAKRKELAEFERHFKAVLKLKRQEQTSK